MGTEFCWWIRQKYIYHRIHQGHFSRLFRRFLEPFFIFTFFIEIHIKALCIGYTKIQVKHQTYRLWFIIICNACEFLIKFRHFIKLKNGSLQFSCIPSDKWLSTNLDGHFQIENLGVARKQIPRGGNLQKVGFLISRPLQK